MQFRILTIFPEIFTSYFNESILGRARKNKIIDIKTHNLRDWTTDRHRTVDDTPYGGGAGMVMKVEPIYKALEAIKQEIKKTKKQNNLALLVKGGRGVKKSSVNVTPLTPLSKGGKTKIILLSAKGKRWNQQLAKKYSKLDSIILICGRYEGVDERIKKFIDEEISIGDYVLTGGEIGAMTIVDSITRLLPGALGNAQSAKDESHSEKGILEYPHYTRPEKFVFAPLPKGGRGVLSLPLSKRGSGGLKTLKVPKVLLSGNHAEIEKWREKNRKKIK